MTSDEQYYQTIKMGQWIIIPDRNIIKLNDEESQLSPKAMKVLAILLEAKGNTVSRDELFDRAWGGVVTSEDALTRVISDLRKTFADTSRAPNYIATVKKSGYRIVADIELLTTTSPLPAKKHTYIVNNEIRWSTRLIALLVAVMSITVIFYNNFFTAPSKVSTSTYSEKKILFSDSDEINPSFDPSRTQFVFSKKQNDGSYNLYTKTIGPQTEQVLISMPGSQLKPRISPNGEEVSFISRNKRQCWIHSFNKLTRVNKKLAVCNSNNFRSTSPSWNNSSDEIYFTFLDNETQIAELRKVNIFTKELSTVITDDSNGPFSGFLFQDISPDGKLVALSLADGKKMLFNQIKVYRLQDKTEVFSYYHSSGRVNSLNWGNNSSLFFLADTAAEKGIWQLDISNNKANFELNVSTDYFDVDHENNTILLSSDYVSSNIYFIPFISNHKETIQVVNSKFRDLLPTINNSNSLLAFVSDRSGSFELWVKNLNTDSETQITNFENGAIFDLAWNPNQPELAFTHQFKSKNRLFTVNLQDMQINAFENKGEEAQYGHWDPQGKNFYWLQLNQKKWSLMKRDMSTHLDSLIYDQLLIRALVIENNQVVILEDLKPTIYLFDIGTGKKRKLELAEEKLFNAVSLQVNNNSLYYLGNNLQSLLAFDLSTNDIKLMSSIPYLHSHYHKERNSSVSAGKQGVYIASSKKPDRDISLYTKSK